MPPGLTVPLGAGADGMPTALQIVTGARREALLLDVAARYQARTDWHRQSPPQPRP
jgi:aspartyl-tRNA(Asn)/glutamyl-tRNA(Gln) amidotransferase subunit A